MAEIDPKTGYRDITPTPEARAWLKGLKIEYTGNQIEVSRDDGRLIDEAEAIAFGKRLVSLFSEESTEAPTNKIADAFGQYAEFMEDHKPTESIANKRSEES